MFKLLFVFDKKRREHHVAYVHTQGQGTILHIHDSGCHTLENQASCGEN